VRRAFLCGKDDDRDFSHRRDWIEARILELSQIFAMDVCAYAVMSNHYHVVLHVNKDMAMSWDMPTLFKRWQQLFSLPTLVEHYLQQDSLDPALLEVVERYAETYRQRLMNISWFMRTLNEPIARMANQEDGCTGRFWEGRFTSQALLDDAAVIACMAYVDLNPVRAVMAETPESSEYTSIKARISAPEIAEKLLPFLTTSNDYKINRPDSVLPFGWADYLELVDWTGRAIRKDKRGSIPANLPSIFSRLNMDADQWLKQHRMLESHYPCFMGQWRQMKSACEQLKRKWNKGINSSRLLFGT
jgi:REP element-mobilizing transposase RayT